MNENVKNEKRKHIFKNAIINLFSWIITNTIWTYITFFVPFGLFIPTIKNIINSIKTKSYTITLIDLIITIILFAIFIAVETFFIYMVNYTKHLQNQKTVNTNTTDNSINNKAETVTTNEEPKSKKEIDYSTLDYYFEKYHKHLTVYKNGNGIIINSFTIIINNINSVTEFKRAINIGDSKMTTEFPKLSNMKRTNLQDRFEKFGFWSKCTNNKSLITSVREHYWSDDRTKDIDTISQSNPKELKWIMQMNPSSIEIGKPYDIIYIISIPDMFPIENGRFDEKIASIKGTHGHFNSKFVVKHKIKKFLYTVSFENDLPLFQGPIGKIYNGQYDKNIPYENKDNIIYNKYIFIAQDPDIGSTIDISWIFMEKNKSKGGKRNDRKKIGNLQSTNGN